MSENRIFKFEKNDIALFIAPLTAISYGMAFIYQLGTYRYYWIPTMFIELNLKNLTATILSVFPLLIFVTIFYYRMINKIRKEDKNQNFTNIEKKSRVIKIIKNLFVLVLFICWAGTGYYLSKTFGFFVVISFFIAYIAIFIGVIFGIVLYKRKKYLSTLLTGVAIAFTLSYTMGFCSSALETVYTVVKIKDKSYVLLETFQSKFILSPVDLETKEFSKQLIMREIKDDFTISTELTILKPEK